MPVDRAWRLIVTLRWGWGEQGCVPQLDLPLGVHAAVALTIHFEMEDTSADSDVNPGLMDVPVDTGSPLQRNVADSRRAVRPLIRPGGGRAV